MPTPRLFGLPEPVPLDPEASSDGTSGKPTQRRLNHRLVAKLLSRPYWDLHESTAWGNSPIDAYFTREFESSDILPDRVGQALG
jgi:hypothetical protein